METKLFRTKHESNVPNGFGNLQQSEIRENYTRLLKNYDLGHVK